MVTCHICGKPVLTGWVCGAPPAMDRYKVGLCQEHDNAENREQARQAWEKMLYAENLPGFENLPPEHRPVTYRLRIAYLDGGQVTIECSHYQVNDTNELLILTRNKELQFHPLQHIRRFDVVEAELPPPNPDTEES